MTPSHQCFVVSSTKFLMIQNTIEGHVGMCNYLKPIYFSLKISRAPLKHWQGTLMIYYNLLHVIVRIKISILKIRVSFVEPGPTELMSMLLSPF